ncbi:MAG: T9SS type A sorting domain-containing protein [Candidatus Cloacimonetes bacterium]|nr:T9SS type A sorting domain-containing protein [Candidatus Cloacimonadota bacterium]
MFKSIWVTLTMALMISLIGAVSETEPNSYWDEAGVLLIENGIHDGMIMPGTDYDYWAFETLQGDTIIVETCNLTNLDTKLWIFGPDGTTLLASGDDECDLQSWVSIITPATGVYYFEIGSYAENMGLYQVSLSGASPFIAPYYPDYATNPNPADGVMNVQDNGTLSWTFGADTETYDLWFGIQGNMVEVVSGGVAGGEGSTGSYAFSVLQPETTYEWQLILHNTNTRFSTDGHLWNFISRIDAITAIPWHEQFNVWPLDYWEFGGPRSWEHYPSANNGCMEANFWYWDDGFAEMTTPPIILDGDCQLQFRWSHDFDSYYHEDSLNVSITNGNGNWTTLLDMCGPDFDSHDGAGNSSPGSFILMTANLWQWTGEQIQIKFHAFTGFGLNLYIDDVRVIYFDNILPPTGLEVSGTGVFTWTPPTNVDNRDFNNYWVFHNNVFQGQTDETTWAFDVSGLVLNQTYTAGVKSSYDSGDSELISIDWVYTGNPTGDDSITPTVTCLEGNFPNPFNPETTIRFALNQPGHVSLNVYNCRGQLVKKLVNKHMPAGRHSVLWNGVNSSGKSIPSGVYFYRMVSNGYVHTDKMILLK